jgi:hypothetical protein
MTALYAHLDGRYFVNEDFIHEVEQLYPATTVKIPLGYHVYVGWEGKDEVFFTSHDPIGRLGIGDDQAYEVSVRSLDYLDRFLDNILSRVEYSDISKELKKELEKKQTSSRIRLTAREDQLLRTWGPTLEERVKTARKGGGLYGYKLSVQKACVRATEKLERKALKLIKEAVRRDEKVLEFLLTHAKRGPSSAAKALINAYKNSLPKLDLDEDVQEILSDVKTLDRVAPTVTPKVPSSTMPGDQDRYMEEAKPMGSAGNYDDPDHSTFKVAGRSKWGLYGFPAKTSKLGLSICSALREEAGILTSDLHAKKARLYDSITGFLRQHKDIGKCGYCDVLLSVYPEADMDLKLASQQKTKATEINPSSVADWLAFDPND